MHIEKQKLLLFVIIIIAQVFCFSGCMSGRTHSLSPSAKSNIIYSDVEEKVEKVLSLAKDGDVYLKNMSGDIIVKSWDRDEIKIAARKVGKSKKELDMASINIEQTDNSIEIATRPKWFPFSLFSNYATVHYELSIPEKARLRIESMSGGVEVYNIDGYIIIETISGDIKVSAARNDVSCKSVSGSIYFEWSKDATNIVTTAGGEAFVKINGSIDLETVSGGISFGIIQESEERR